jgi:hypothetical protein
MLFDAIERAGSARRAPSTTGFGNSLSSSVNGISVYVFKRQAGISVVSNASSSEPQ